MQQPGKEVDAAGLHIHGLLAAFHMPNSDLLPQSHPRGNCALNL